MRKASLIIGILIFTALFLRFVIGGPEDDWLCRDGEWVKHGAPGSPMPTEVCEK